MERRGSREKRGRNYVTEGWGAGRGERGGGRGERGERGEEMRR